MNNGLDLLGADGLNSKYVTLRVRHVDGEKLKEKLGGIKGASVPLALSLVNAAPETAEVALNAALPYVVRKAHDDYGVDLDYVVSDAPLKKGESQSGLGLGVATGLGLAGAGWAVWRYLLRGLL